MQEGFWRLWRGTNASLTLAIPTVSHSLSSTKDFLFHLNDYLLCMIPCFVVMQNTMQFAVKYVAGIYWFLLFNQVGIYMPCYDIFRNLMEEFTTQNAPNLTPYVPLVAGTLARSLACVSCYPIELARTRMQVSEFWNRKLMSYFILGWPMILTVSRPINK